MSREATLANLLRNVVRKGTHGKIKGQHVVALQWIGYESLINNWANWLAETPYEGPIFAFDSFERRKSTFRAPRPDNYPAPEPSARLRVTVGYDDIPQPASVIFVGPETPRKVANKVIKEAPEGCFVIWEEGSLGVARQVEPLLHCEHFVAGVLR